MILNLSYFDAVALLFFGICLLAYRQPMPCGSLKP